jgi:hypothetical protein
MNAVAAIDLPPAAAGVPLEGGFYVGGILTGGTLYALIVAPKAEGEFAESAWSESYQSVPGALSWNDGMANTLAAAEAGIDIAKWALGLRIGGYSDWYWGAVDECELTYRHLKPTTEDNSLWARSGINVSAVPPTFPYTADFPKQTENELFRAGGSEAFEAAGYWTSTPHASDSYYAWFQGSSGFQGYWGKGYKLRARAFRRLPI